MQQIDRKNLNFELRPESYEDLWILSQFIVPEDKIFATTERKVKVGSDTNSKQVKKLIYVELLVKKSSFENQTLRLSGEILNETEFTAIGQAHTLNFNPNDKLSLEKKSLLKFEEKLLKDSIESKKTKNLLILLDKDELIATEFNNFTFSVLFEKSNLGSKKGVEEINEEEEKFKIIEEFIKKDYSTIILSGPGLWKNRLSKYIENKTNLKCISFNFPDVNTSAVERAIKAINEKGLISDTQLSIENKFIAKLLENINKGSKYIYSEKNTFNTITEGKIETLLITTKFIANKKEDNTYIQLNELMRTAEQMNCELVIVNSKNESGKVLDGLGGIGGILRY